MNLSPPLMPKRDASAKQQARKKRAVVCENCAKEVDAVVERRALIRASGTLAVGSVTMDLCATCSTCSVCDNEDYPVLWTQSGITLCEKCCAYCDACDAHYPADDVVAGQCNFHCDACLSLCTTDMLGEHNGHNYCPSCIDAEAWVVDDEPSSSSSDTATTPAEAAQADAPADEV
jgi:hypothetical protein